ncbi:glycosyltransferase [Alteribacillus sp. JSM 102045]|uniref:glycosyltransferase n=1 Tax=Alteribacillus sp. JSM 102045 TaxID=1562101 RepID=UPI0035C181E1
MKEKKTLNILYLTPYFSSKRGNATTAKRMQEYLKKAGLKVNVFAFDEEAGSIEGYLAQVDIVHALHVRRTAEWLSSTGISIQKPFIITTGGTDINVDLKEKHKKNRMQKLLEKADALTVFTKDGKEKVLRHFPQFSEKVQVIPQAVPLPITNKEVQFSLPAGSPNILLPAGLRPVKDVLYVLKELDELKQIFCNLEFVLIGEALDEDVEMQVIRAAKQRPWFTYLPPVEQEEMHALYDWADAVINTSQSEGQPVSLLEGMSEGVPVLARNNPGNQSVIKHSYNGYLFSSPEEFFKLFYQLFSHQNLYKRLSEQARDYVFTHHHPEEEADKYIRLYKKILQQICK